MQNTILGVLFILAAVIVSCDKGSNGNETLISRHSENESHKDGQDCMSCHQSGGRGEGWFVVAELFMMPITSQSGSVLIKLYDGPVDSGNLVKTIGRRWKGYFILLKYRFWNGLYTSVTSSKGNVKKMISPITDGMQLIRKFQ
ncbi:MAG: hypothetical protein R2764_24160 [Bacteroidales bacterium]